MIAMTLKATPVTMLALETLQTQTLLSTSFYLGSFAIFNRNTQEHTQQISDPACPTEPVSYSFVFLPCTIVKS